MKNASLSLHVAHRELKEKLRGHPFILVIVKMLGVALGAFFFYAGLQKHLAPYQFAEAVMAYQLIPQSLVGYIAVILPWVELTAGFFLVLGYMFEALGRMTVGLGFASGAVLVGGIKRRSCLLLIMALALLFIIVMLLTLARGLKIDCGCGLFFQRQVGAVAILENVLFGAVATALYWWEIPGEKEPQ